jgi:hypothetical protein
MKLIEIKSKELRMKDFPKFNMKSIDEEMKRLKSDLDSANLHMDALRHDPDKKLRDKWVDKHHEAFKAYEYLLKKSVAIDKYNKALSELERFLEK